MLDLYVAQAEGRKISIKSLAVAACVPPTTAMRWVRYLVAEQIFARETDADDRRSALVCMTPPTFARMTAILEAASGNHVACARA